MMSIYNDVNIQWLIFITKIPYLNYLFGLTYKLLFPVRPLRRCKHHAQGLGWWKLNSLWHQKNV